MSLRKTSQSASSHLIHTSTTQSKSSQNAEMILERAQSSGGECNMQRSLWACMIGKFLSHPKPMGSQLMVGLGIGIAIIIGMAMYVKVLDAQYLDIQNKKGEPLEDDKACMCQ
jgi:hypothetical protein